MTITSIRLHPELEAPLEALSKKLDRNRSSLINQAIKEFVSKHALAEQRWQETLPALESINAGRTVSADKVFEWMRSWGSDNGYPGQCWGKSRRNNPWDQYSRTKPLTILSISNYRYPDWETRHDTETGPGSSLRR